MDHRRTGEAPLSARHDVVPGIHWTEALVPHWFSIHAKTEQTFRSENRHNALPIGRRRGIAMRRFRMTRNLRQAFVAESVPNDFAIVLIDRQETPLLRVVVRNRLDISI